MMINQRILSTMDILRSYTNSLFYKLNHCKLASGFDGKIRYNQPLKYGSFSTSDGFDCAWALTSRIFPPIGHMISCFDPSADVATAQGTPCTRISPGIDSSNSLIPSEAFRKRSLTPMRAIPSSSIRTQLTYPSL